MMEASVLAFQVAYVVLNLIELYGLPVEVGKPAEAMYLEPLGALLTTISPPLVTLLKVRISPSVLYRAMAASVAVKMLAGKLVDTRIVMFRGNPVTRFVVRYCSLSATIRARRSIGLLRSSLLRKISFSTMYPSSVGYAPSVSKPKARILALISPGIPWSRTVLSESYLVKNVTYLFKSISICPVIKSSNVSRFLMRWALPL